MSQVRVDEIVDANGGSNAVLRGAAAPVGGMNFRNRIINGDMRIDQRNNGASVTPTDGQYTLDRWKAGLSAASKFSIQRNAGSVTPPVGFTNYLGVTSLSAYSSLSADYFFLSQPIEGLNTSDLGWGTANAQAVTLSFWVRSSLTGTFGGAFRNSANNRSYPFTYAISAANTWEQKTVTVAGDTSGTWLTTNAVGIEVDFNLGTGTTFSGTAGAWASSNFVSATGAVSVVGTNGATFYITGVQLEAGSVATPFERRPYGTEEMLCKRYYHQISSESTGGGFGNLNFHRYIDGTNAYVAIEAHPVPMRAGPTITFESGIRIHLPAIAVENGTFSANRSTPARFNLGVTPTTNNSAVKVAYPDGDGATAKRIFFNAEL